MKGRKRFFAKTISAALAVGMIFTSLPLETVLAAGESKNGIETDVAVHAGEYTVSGTISKYQGDDSKATVKIYGTEITAQESGDGTYRLSGVDAGNHTLEVSCDGYATFYERINVESDITKNVALFPAYERAEEDGADYEIDYAQEADVSNAWTLLEQSSGDGAVSVTKDENGACLAFTGSNEVRTSAYMTDMPAMKDGCVEMEVTLKNIVAEPLYGGAKYIGILLRAQDGNTRITVGNRSYGDRSIWEYWDGKSVSEIPTGFGDNAPDSQPRYVPKLLQGNKYTLKAEIKGRRITWWINGENLFAKTNNFPMEADFPQVAGKIGLECAAGTEIIVHNVKVTSYDGPADGQNAVVGKVVNGTEPVGGSVVTLTDKNDSSKKFQKTVNENGYFVFGQVPAGTYTQAVSWENDFASWSKYGASGSLSKEITVTGRESDGAAYCVAGIDIFDDAISSITKKPEATAWEGDATVPLQVEAAGDSPSYQWYESGSEYGENATEIAGATANSYTPALADGEMQKYYYCVVTSTANGVSRTVQTDIVPVYRKRTVTGNISLAYQYDDVTKSDVKLVSSSSGREIPATVKADGSYTADAPDGTYTLKASYDGYGEQSAEITLSSEQLEVTHDFTLVPEHADYEENFAGNENAKDVWSQVYGGGTAGITNDADRRGVLLQLPGEYTGVSPIYAPEFVNGCVEMDLIPVSTDYTRIGIGLRGTTGADRIFIGSGDGAGGWFSQTYGTSGEHWTGENHPGISYSQNQPIHLKAEIKDKTVTLWGGNPGGSLTQLQSMSWDNMSQNSGKVTVECRYSRTVIVSNIKVTSYDEVTPEEGEAFVVGKITGTDSLQNVTVKLQGKGDNASVSEERRIFPGYYSFKKMPAGNYSMSVSWKDEGGIQTQTRDVTVTAGGYVSLPEVNLDEAPKFSAHPQDAIYSYSESAQADPLSVTVKNGASLTGLTYQWYKCGESGEDSEEISGQTSAEYRPSITKEELSTYYYCIATYTNGTVSGTVQSDIANIMVGTNVTGNIMLYGNDDTANVTLMLLKEDGTAMPNQAVMKNGAYTFKRVPIGDYIIQASCEGYLLTEDTIHVAGVENDVTHNIILFPDCIDYGENFAGNENAKDMWRQAYKKADLDAVIANDAEHQGVSIAFPGNPSDASESYASSVGVYPIGAPEFKDGCVEMDLICKGGAAKRIGIILRETELNNRIYVGTLNAGNDWFREYWNNSSSSTYGSDNNAGKPTFPEGQKFHLKAEIKGTTVKLWGGVSGATLTELISYTNSGMPQNVGKVGLDCGFTRTLVVSNIKVTSYDEVTRENNEALVFGKITGADSLQNVTVKLEGKDDTSFSEEKKTFPGYYAFKKVPAGNYSMSVSWKDEGGIQTQTRDVTVTAAEDGYVSLPEVNLAEAVPKFSAHPQDAIYPYSESAQADPLSVTVKNGASLTGLTYQWYKCSESGEDPEAISGQTSAEYRPSITREEQCSYYYCVVTYANGAVTGTARSDIASVIVGTNVTGNVMLYGDDDTANVTLKLLKEDGTAMPNQAVIKDGAYTFEGVPQGEYTIVAGCEGYLTADGAVSVTDVETDVTHNIWLLPECADYEENFAGNESAKDVWSQLYGGGTAEITNDTDGRGTLLQLPGEYTGVFPIYAPEFVNGCVEMDLIPVSTNYTRIGIGLRGTAGAARIFIGSGDGAGGWFAQAYGASEDWSSENRPGVSYSQNKPIHLKAEIKDKTVTLWGGDPGGSLTQLQSWSGNNMSQNSGKVTVECRNARTVIVSNIKVTSYDEVTRENNETAVYGKITGTDSLQNVTVKLQGKGDNASFSEERRTLPGYYSFKKVPAGTYSMTVSWKEEGCLRAQTQDITVTADGEYYSLPKADLDTAKPAIAKQPQDQVCLLGTEGPSLTVETDTEGATYQWYGKKSSETEFTAIDGATGATCRPSIESAEDWRYYCVLTYVDTAKGITGTAQSKTATVMVKRFQAAPKPSVTAPGGTAVACPQGEEKLIHVTAAFGADDESKSNILAYQWYQASGEEASKEDTAIEGATAPTYAVPTGTIGRFYYYCVVTNTNTEETIDVTPVTASSPIFAVRVQKDKAEAPIVSAIPDEAYAMETKGHLIFSVTASVEEKGGELTYQWYEKANAEDEQGTAIEGATSNKCDFTKNTQGAYYIYCEVTHTDPLAVNPASVVSNTVTVTVTKPTSVTAPAITSQPQNAEYETGAQIAALMVEADVEPGKYRELSYQWYKAASADSTENGTAIDGATENVYMPDEIGNAAATAYYYCIVTNTNDELEEGSKTASVTSDVATITAIVPTAAAEPQIETDLPAEKTYRKDERNPEALSLTAKLAAGKAGTLSYQWYQNTENSAEGGTAIDGATESGYTPDVTKSGAMYYYCVVTNTNPNASGNSKTTSIKSSVVKVTVKTESAQQPVISADLSEEEVSYGQGETAKALVVAVQELTDGGTLSYQWYKKTTTTGEGEAITGANEASYTPSTSEAGTTYYYCVVTNTNPYAESGSPVSATSKLATVKVNAPAQVEAETPVIAAQPQGASYEKDETAAALSVTASVTDGGTLSYQWYGNTANSNTGGTAISGATEASYTPSTAAEGTTYYYCVVTNTKGGDSKTATTNTAKIEVREGTVQPPEEAETPTITGQPQGASYEKDETAAALSVTASVTDGGTLSYQWYGNTANSNTGGTAISGATEASYTPSTAEEGTTYYYCVVTNTKDGKSKTATTNTAKIEVTEEAVQPPEEAETPTITVQPQGASYKKGGTAAVLSVTASVTDGGTLSYQWYSNTADSNEDGTAIGGATEASYTPSTAAAGITYYYCEVTNTKGESSNTAKTNTAKIEVTNVTVAPAVTAAKPTITAHPKSASYTKGQTAVAMSVTAKVTDGGKLSYQWYRNTANSNARGTVIAGANQVSYTPSTAAAGVTYYYCVVTNTKSGKTNTATTNTAKIEVKEAEITAGTPITLSNGMQYVVLNVKSGEVAFAGSAKKSATNVTIPSTISSGNKKYKVTEIKAKAFKGFKKLKKVTIGANIKKIGKQAFYNCKKLKTIIFKGTKVKTIQSKAFKGVPKKVTVKMPKKLKKKAKKTLKSRLIRAGINKKAKFK